LLQLNVVSDNDPARLLYTRLRFIEYGVEKNSLKQHGHYYDEILMALDLRQKQDAAAHTRRVDTARCEERPSATIAFT